MNIIKIKKMLVCMLLLSASLFAAPLAQQQESSISGFVNPNDGSRLAQGTVEYFTNDALTTPIDVWSDSGKLSVLSQPIDLNDAGIATDGANPITVFIDGTVWMRLKDEDGVTIYTGLALSYNSEVDFGGLYIDISSTYGTDTAAFNSAFSDFEGGSDVTFLLNSDSYTYTDTKSLASNIKFLMINNATLSLSGVFTYNHEEIEMKDTSSIIGSGTIIFVNNYLNAPDNTQKFGSSLTVSGNISNGNITPRWWGAIGNAVNDDTVAIQSAIDFAIVKQSKVFMEAGNYLVTDTLTIYNGTHLEGQLGGQFTNSFDMSPISTRITFKPTTEKDLFDIAGFNSVQAVSGFRNHIKVSGLYLYGDSATGTNAKYGLNLENVIYSTFRDIGISGFQSGVYCSDTINNRFENIKIDTSSVASIQIIGNATTDVWDQCTFFSAPVGVSSNGSIGVRFAECLFEQLDNYGAQISRADQSIIFDHCYSEDVPFANNDQGSMFRVAFNGTQVTENHLIVTGGKYSGRNAGVVGSWLNTDTSQGVIISNVNVSRYTNVVSANATTRENSTIVSGIAGISFTNFANSLTSIAGIYPRNVINSGNNDQLGLFGSVTTELIAGSSLVLQGSTSIALNTTLVKPSVTATTDIGSDSIRFKDLYLSGDAEVSENIISNGHYSINSSLADDATSTYNVSLTGMIMFQSAGEEGSMITYDTSSGSEVINIIAQGPGTSFSVAPTSNPDVDTTWNLWVAGEKEIVIKNRIGASRFFSISNIAIQDF